MLCVLLFKNVSPAFSLAGGLEGLFALFPAPACNPHILVGEARLRDCVSPTMRSGSVKAMDRVTDEF